MITRTRVEAIRDRYSELALLGGKCKCGQAGCGQCAVSDLLAYVDQLTDALDKRRRKRMGKIDGKAILDIKMSDNDADAKTVRDYLKALLSAIWEEGESFSGKRPFGNSGWEYDLYRPLVEAGAVKGKIVDGELADVDERAADQAVFDAIDALQ